MHQLAMPKQKIGRAILGSAKIIENLPRATVIDYVNAHYTGANMVLVAAGKITHDDFVENG